MRSECSSVVPEKVIITDRNRKFCVSSTERRIELFQAVCDVTGDDRDSVINAQVYSYILETLKSDRIHHIYNDADFLRIKKVFTCDI
jgi:hypothetical protein